MCFKFNLFCLIFVKISVLINYLNSNKDNFEIYDSAYQKIDATDTLITLNTKKEIEDIKIDYFL